MTNSLPPDDVDAFLRRPLPEHPIYESQATNAGWIDPGNDDVIRAIMLDADYERAIQQHITQRIDENDLRRQLTEDLSAAQSSFDPQPVVVVPPLMVDFVRACATPLQVLSYTDINAGASIYAIVTLQCPTALQPAPLPPMDPDLVARMEAAQDENGVIHDPELANDYFEALLHQGDEMRRLAGWPEPIIESGKVFPSAGADAPVLDYREGEAQIEVGPSTMDPPDEPGPVQVVIY